jgi:hypothetical protein
LNNYKVLEGEEFFKKFYKRNIIVNSTSFIRKSAINEVGLYENIKKMVDYNLWLRLILMDKRFIFIPDVVISSRIHDNQVSHKRISSKIIFRILILRIKVGQKLRLNPLNAFVSNLIWLFGKVLTETGLRKSRLKKVLKTARNG